MFFYCADAGSTSIRTIEVVPPAGICREADALTMPSHHVRGRHRALCLAVPAAREQAFPQQQRQRPVSVPPLVPDYLGVSCSWLPKALEPHLPAMRFFALDAVTAVMAEEIAENAEKNYYC